MVVPIPIRNACNIYWESMVCFMMISNRKTYLWILTFILAFSSYLFDASVAMAQPQRDAEPVTESSYEEEDYNTDKGKIRSPMPEQISARTQSSLRILTQSRIR